MSITRQPARYTHRVSSWALTRSAFISGSRPFLVDFGSRAPALSGGCLQHMGRHEDHPAAAGAAHYPRVQDSPAIICPDGATVPASCGETTPDHRRRRLRLCPGLRRRDPRGGASAGRRRGQRDGAARSGPGAVAGGRGGGWAPPRIAAKRLARSAAAALRGALRTAPRPHRRPPPLPRGPTAARACGGARRPVARPPGAIRQPSPPAPAALPRRLDPRSARRPPIRGRAGTAARAGAPGPMAASCPSGVTEWMVHPGHPDSGSGSGYDRGRGEDLELLLSIRSASAPSSRSAIGGTPSA